MNILDIILSGIILLSMVIGVMRGGTREIFGILGWLAAAALTLMWWEPARDVLTNYISTRWLATSISVVGILIVSLLLFTLLSRFIAKLIKASPLGGLDRFLGLVYGAVRGFTLVFVSFYILSQLIAGQMEIPLIKESKVGAMAQPTVEWVIKHIPAGVKNSVSNMLDKTMEQIETTTTEEGEQPQNKEGANEADDQGAAIEETTET